MIRSFLIILQLVIHAFCDNMTYTPDYTPIVVTFEGDIISYKAPLTRPEKCCYGIDKGYMSWEGPAGHWYSTDCIWASKENRTIKEVSNVTNLTKCMEECAAEEKCTHFYWNGVKRVCHLLTGFDGSGAYFTRDYPVFCGNLVNTYDPSAYTPGILTFEGDILSYKGVANPIGACCGGSDDHWFQGPADHWYLAGCVFATKENRKIKEIANVSTIDKCMEECAAEVNCTHFYWRQVKNVCHLLTEFIVNNNFTTTYTIGGYYLEKVPMFCGVKSLERKKHVGFTFFKNLLYEIGKGNVYGGNFKNQ